MEADRTRIIISDLHIGADDDFDIFKGADKTQLFAEFMAHVGERPGPVELIVNGDLVDFLQLRPWDDLSRTTALAKIKKIVRANWKLFQTFGKFLEGDGHRVTVLLGNHDVELGYPEVADVLCGAMTRGVPGADERLGVFRGRVTYNLRLNDKTLLHVEHGNLGDPANWIDYGPLWQDAEKGTTNFKYPPGTDFVYKMMNGFKESFRFVDLLKPEFPAVPLLLLALKPWAATRGIPGGAWTLLETLENGYLSKLHKMVAGRPLGAAASGGASGLDRLFEDLVGYCVAPLPAEALSETLYRDVLSFLDSPEALRAADEPTFAGGAWGARVKGWAEAVRAGLARVGAKVTDAFVQRADTVKGWLVVRALQGLKRFGAAQLGDAFFGHDHWDSSLGGYAVEQFTGKERVPGQRTVVVFGHTHEALKAESDDGIYINSGAWANLMAVPKADDDALREWLQKLADNTFERTATPTYVTIQPAGEEVSLSLNRWAASGEEPLWQKTI